jgi:DNA-binding GntR family transcriptional regulator
MSEYAAEDGHRTGGERPGLKYRKVADGIIDAIKSGVLKEGTRLLPEREAARRSGYSIGTIRHAYEYVCDQKLAYTEHGSGTFVGQPGQTPVPPTPEEQAAQAREDEAGL